MRRTSALSASIVLLTAVLAVACATSSTEVAPAAGGAAAIPARPEQLSFPELEFEVPDPAALRFELGSGTPVYAKEDHQFPLINLSVYFKGGKYLEPADKAGLVALASEVWRTGGAGERSAQELDEELDFLAANLATDIGDVTGSVSVNFLAKDVDTVLPILMDVLTRPRFQADRFAKAKDDLIQDMKTRNDDAGDIEEREWSRLIYGDDYWMNRLATKASTEAVTAGECKAFVDRLVRSDNIVVAVAGDFDREQMRAILDRTIGTLPKLGAPLPAVPQPDHTPEPGVYVVDKEDVNQGRVSIGHMGYREGHPDEFALMLMNDILGGGGFTARMMKKVRSDEGLTYGAYSDLSFPITMPGVFRAYFSTKSSTVAYATELTMGLIRGMQEAPVTQEELDTTKPSFIETFPRRFESAARTVATFATGDLLGRAPDYWATYRQRIAALNAEELQDAAARDLHPDKMIVLVVGPVEEILEGHPDHPVSLEDFGTIHRLPLRDPLTLEPIQE